MLKNFEWLFKFASYTILLYIGWLLFDMYARGHKSKFEFKNLFKKGGKK